VIPERNNDVPNRLDGKVAIVTGAGSGFGRATALLFALEGAAVVIADIDEEASRQTVALIAGRGPGATIVAGDVSEKMAADTMVEQALSEFGRLDVLVNNAGIAQQLLPGQSWDAPEEQWDRLIRVNLRSVYVCSRAGVPAMRASGGGSIVNVASIAASVSVGGSAYAAAKGGMLSYTRHVAVELAPEIRVNCVSPGFMWTPMSTGERFGLSLEEQARRKEEFAARSPMNRAGDPQDIAKAILFFACDDSAFVTGRELVVDGGHLVRS
jgi:NAD(P)-dependent dehydrogenase (short-subunit alcohol dehydrogenase family)